MKCRIDINIVYDFDPALYPDGFDAYKAAALDAANIEDGTLSLDDFVGNYTIEAGTE